MDSLNENLRNEDLEEFFRTKEVAISSAISNPLPFLQGLRNESIISEEEFEHIENKTVTTRKNNKVLCTEENNLMSSAAMKTPAGGTKRRRRPQRQTRSRGKIPRIPKGKKILKVSCGDATGVLYTEIMKKGVLEKCIKDSDGKWFTPSEFEVKGGRGTWKCWKRSIRFNRVPLGDLIKKGKLPKPRNHRKKKRKTASGLVHQSPQFQSSGSRRRRRRVVDTSSSSSEVSSDASPTPPHTWVPATPEEGARQRRRRRVVDTSSSFSEVSSAAFPAASPEEGARRRRRRRVVDTSSSSSEVSLAASPAAPYIVPASPEEAAAETVEEQQQQQPGISTASAGVPPHAITSCQSILHKIGEGIFKISSNCSNMEVRLQATKNLLDGLQERLEQVSNMSDVQKQMNDIIHYQAKLHTSVGRLLEAQSLEEP